MPRRPPTPAAPRPSAETPSGLEDYLGHRVVLDTRSPYLILGTLARIDRDCLTLRDVDVHDSSCTSTTKDRYILEAHRLGVCVNRAEVKVRLAEVISLSRLDDIKTF